MTGYISNAFQAQLLAFIFQNVSPPLLAGVSTLYLSLHTADPSPTGSQATNECNYSGYARQAVARSALDWIISGGSPTDAALAAAALFPAPTGAGQVATNFAVGVAASGASAFLYSGPIEPAITVNPGVIPETFPLVCTMD